jgi:hypothetical protein
MAKLQRRFKIGAEYTVEGKALKKRRLQFANTIQIDGREHLLFRPVRAAKKAS